MIQDLESKMERITNKSIADIEAGFKRGVSLDERFLRLKNRTGGRTYTISSFKTFGLLFKS